MTSQGLNIKKMWKVQNTDPKKIISFSLFGDMLIYNIGAVHNTILARWVYPGWTCRFYVDHTVPKKTIKSLLDEGAQVYYIQNSILEGFDKSVWRFFVMSEPVTFLCRDADSRVNSKEAWAVNEWLKSGRQFHRMWDAYGHDRPILAGMWGAVQKKPLRPNIESQLIHWVKDPRARLVGRGVDELFLLFEIFNNPKKPLKPSDIISFGTGKTGVGSVDLIGIPFAVNINGWVGKRISVRIVPKFWKADFINVRPNPAYTPKNIERGDKINKELMGRVDVIGT